MSTAETQDLAPEMIRAVAVANGVCVRPIMQRLVDTLTGREQLVPIDCGSTQDRKCPTCAERNRRLRMQQCREGWHTTEETLPPLPDPGDHDHEDQDDEPNDGSDDSPRRVRSTRRRQDVPDLPRLPVEHRSIGRAFTGNHGQTYRPSMFITTTLGSYGPVYPDGTPVDPATYDYRRQVLDAMHFPKLVDRLIQNLRRCAGYKMQYFGCIEAQKRLAPHLHMALRGVIPRQMFPQVVAATYHQVWWPHVDQPVYTGTHLPVWDEAKDGYVDPDDGVLLQTWAPGVG